MMCALGNTSWLPGKETAESPESLPKGGGHSGGMEKGQRPSLRPEARSHRDPATMPCNKTHQLQKPGATLAMAHRPHGGTGAKAEQWLVKGQHGKDRRPVGGMAASEDHTCFKFRKTFTKAESENGASEMVHR